MAFMRSTWGRIRLFVLCFSLPLVTSAATSYNLGVITLDSLILGNGLAAPGITVFNIVNLTGDPVSGGAALPQDFPVVTPVTFSNAQLTVVVGGTPSVISLGSIAPGVFTPSTSLQFPDTTQFDSATFTATMNTTSLSLSGGGTTVINSAQVTATITPSAPHLQRGVDFAVLQTSAGVTVTKTHSGNFALGQTGATYIITVSNAAGSTSTSGTVTVTETIPSGLTLVSMAGTGWTCPNSGNTCSRSDALAGGASYPPITATVNVAANATSPQVNQVSVSVGGTTASSATDSTTVGSGSPVSVTLATNPTGLAMVIDGSSVTAPQTVSWVPGSNHTVNVTSPQGAGGTRYVFSNWSDAGAQSHTIVGPATGTTYIANFSAQYLLTANASPANGGTVVANPAGSSGYYDSGTTVQLTATPATGYAFTQFSGDIVGATNSQPIVMSAPHTVTAAFTSVGTAPSIISVSPSSGTGATQSFTGAYAAANGYHDLQWVQMLFAVASDGGGQSYCFVHYDVQGNGFWVYGDGGFFVGPITPGTASNRLQNSLCALNTLGSTVTGSGATLTINPSLIFKQSGARNIYMRAMNEAQVDSGWVQRGTWSVGPAGVGTLSVVPASGTGATQTFTLTYPDPPGFAGAAFGWVQFLVAAASDGGGQPFCYLHYDRAGNGLWMYSSDVGFFLGPITPGTTSNALSSSACSINTAGTTVTNSGGNLVIAAPITLKGPMSGSKKLFQRTLDVLNRDTGWQQTGTWIIP